MAGATALLFAGEEATERLHRNPLVEVARRGPILRPSPVKAGLYGIDLTAGCDHACPFCHIRGSARTPGPDKVLFDPRVDDRLARLLDEMELLPDRVLLSPASDPFPAQRPVREAAERVIDRLLRRGIGVTIHTRGRIPRRLIGRLAEKPDRVAVSVPILTTDRALARTLEPRAASPGGRLRTIARLVAAGLAVEARLEPLVPGLTDTPENLRPLFVALAKAGVSRVVAHYLFLTGSIADRVPAALAPIGWQGRLTDLFQGGPVFPLGTLGATKHLPKATRQTGLAGACWQQGPSSACTASRRDRPRTRT